MAPNLLSRCTEPAGNLARSRSVYASITLTDSTGAQTMNSRVTLFVAGAAALLTGAVAPSMLAGAEAPATGATTTTTGAATATTEPAFVLPPGYRYLVDDTNRITVAVPETWTDIETFPGAVAGSSIPAVHAATDPKDRT